MQKHEQKALRNMKYQGNKTSPKEHKFPASEPKEMHIYKQLDKDFKINVLRKLSQLQENTNRNSIKVGKKYTNKSTGSKNGSSLAIQWLGLHTPTAGGTGSIPSQGTKMLHATWCGQKTKNKKFQDTKKKKKGIKFWS